MNSNRLFFLTLVFTLFLSGCNTKKAETQEQESKQVILGKMTLEGGWARPGSKGQTSAAYFNISNGTASPDTIVSVSSPIAQKAGIHESYKGENGLSGMRPAPNQVIAAGTDLYLRPGGLHLMLMELKNKVAVGDSIQISVTFNRNGTKTIRLPVQLQK